mgnify:CR=1 FL=1
MVSGLPNSLIPSRVFGLRSLQEENGEPCTYATVPWLGPNACIFSVAEDGNLCESDTWWNNRSVSFHLYDGPFALHKSRPPTPEGSSGLRFSSFICQRRLCLRINLFQTNFRQHHALAPTSEVWTLDGFQMNKAYSGTCTLINGHRLRTSEHPGSFSSKS